MPIKFVNKTQEIDLIKKLLNDTVPNGHKINLETDNCGWHISQVYENEEDYREEKILEISEDLHTLRFNHQFESIPEWILEIAREIDNFFGGEETIQIVTF